MRQPDIVSEARLKALREEAARTGEVKGGGVVPSGAPFPRPNTPGYYGIPLLKELGRCLSISSSVAPPVLAR
jgi:hypothetical protein